MSHAVPATEYPNGIFPSPSDQTQKLKDGFIFTTCWKGVLTRSHIFERMCPDGQTSALRIDGPDGTAGFITLQNNGSIVIGTGEKNVEKGASSGKLCIHTHGQQQKHEQVTHIEYNCGDDGDEALNIIAYGDIVEEATGSERHIKAQKIVITAEEELFLIGKSQVFIQAGSNGGGTIQMSAGTIEQVVDNKKDIVFGQKMTFGAGEETSVQFDPRASQNIVSPGHVNWSILGDYKQWVGGVSQTIIAGKPSVPPLIKARDTSYSVNTVIGGASIKAADGIITTAGGAITSTAGGAITSAAGGASTMTASGVMTVAASGAMNITGGAAVTITAAGNVAITGALILLN